MASTPNSDQRSRPVPPGRLAHRPLPNFIAHQPLPPRRSPGASGQRPTTRLRTPPGLPSYLTTPSLTTGGAVQSIALFADFIAHPPISPLYPAPMDLQAHGRDHHLHRIARSRAHDARHLARQPPSGFTTGCLPTRKSFFPKLGIKKAHRSSQWAWR